MSTGTNRINIHAKDNENRLRAFVPMDGISMMAILLSKGEPKKNANTNSNEKGKGKSVQTSSQQFEAFLGSVSRSDIPEVNRIGETAILIPVAPPSIQTSYSVNQADNRSKGDISIGPDSNPHKDVSPNTHHAALPAPPISKINDKKSKELIPYGGATDEQLMNIDLENISEIDAPPAIPQTYELHSFNTYKFSTCNISALKNVALGELVILNGIKAKASEPRGKYTTYAVFLNVVTVEKASGITLCDLYRDSYVKDQLTASWLTPLSPVSTDENIGQTPRYDSTSLYIDIKHDIDEESCDNRYISARIPKPETSTTGIPKNAWVTQTADQDSRIKASLSYSIQQWKEGNYCIDNSNSTMQKVLIDLNIYESLLEQFCIVELTKWKALAPIIFSNLDYKAICQLDKTGTRTSFGGINGEIDTDEIFDFALSLRASCILADIFGVYQRIGIPVTEEWVCKHFGIPVKSTSSSNFPLPSVQSMDKEDDRSRTIGSPNVEYRVLINFTEGLFGKKTWDHISGLNVDQGIELMQAIESAKILQEEPTFSDPKLSFLFQRLPEVLEMSIFALSKTSENMGTSELRKSRIERFLHGVRLHPPPSSLSLKYNADSDITSPSSGEPQPNSIEDTESEERNQDKAEKSAKKKQKLDETPNETPNETVKWAKGSKGSKKQKKSK